MPSKSLFYFGFTTPNWKFLQVFKLSFSVYGVGFDDKNPSPSTLQGVWKINSTGNTNIDGRSSHLWKI